MLVAWFEAIGSYVGSGVFSMATAYFGLPSLVAQPLAALIPNGSAFVRFSAKAEVDARSGQWLRTDVLLCTTKLGRKQMMLGTGRLVQDGK
tara:strand:- start:510 stop:782 length:273 start_codon:yes stop_codon:yes gene_type:complete